ncbi:choline-sulfatase [Devosia enhydra]|uniref:Choline-sulfatase n=1 Tax=Devosia enhydra TaxID=665118 RepID=A0A1K2HT08_9HYPH|nr:sulfatase-like hydrolase/transferase [Devosia enhydra]SFZ81230.1 choline-sulfatase [Devosia enhydra]
MARPNILWLFADELRAPALGCYGEAWAPVHTPHLDSLAARGVRFTNAYCNSPACVPSRLSMLTANLPERTGVYSNEGSWRSYPLPHILPTFPQHFAAAGYRVASIGKSHHHAAYHPWPEDNGEGSSMHGFGLDTNPKALEPIVPAGIPSPVGGVFPSDKPYPPEAVTWNATRWLDAHAGEEPFFLRVSWLQPHTPVLPPAHYRRMYRPSDWPGHNLPAFEGSVYEEAFAEMVGGRAFSHEQMQQAQADYHALTTWVDAQVGLVLGMLKLRGLLENTIVLFTADHGASLGENGLFAKVVHARQSQRVPLIVSWPGHLPEGEVRCDLAQGLDLARTFCGFAGLAPDDSFAGRDLFADPEPDAIWSTLGSGASGSRASSAANNGLWRNGGGWPRRTCIRTARYRFDMNVRQDGAAIAPAEEDPFLADTLADPLEQHNLAADPAHAGLIAEFRARVLAHAATAIEPDFVPAFSPDESPEFLPPRIAAH